MTRILQIVPHLPPPFEGVGTYAAALAGALTKGRNVETRFLVGDPAWSGESREHAEPIAARTAAALLAKLEAEETVLLHYAGYGYQERGCPVWLVSGVTRWLARGGRRRLLTFFHEVNAFGPPWRSSFWLSPVQRRLSSSLANASSGIATSLPLYRDVLHRWLPGRPVAVLPVFSAIGEPAEVPPLRSRLRRLAVFGGAGTRLRAFREHRTELEEASRAFGIEEVLDIGPGEEVSPPSVCGRPVRRMGVLPASEVGALLLNSLAGFLAYPPSFLPKSTVFAAYCANGMVPICAASGRNGGPLAAGDHYLPPRLSHPPTEPELQAVAARARAWYTEHSLERQTESFFHLISGGGAPR